MNFEPFELLVRHAANGLGIDITRYRPRATQPGRLATMLEHHKVDLLLDIGANVGQFALGMRRVGYIGRMRSFEPVTQAHTQLVKAAASDPGWSIAPRVAIGDHEGEIEMHVAENGVSSSALDMLERHETSAPDSAYVANERVRVSRLDTMVIEDLATNPALFIKIDTQGYEDRVLRGAQQALGLARGLQLELSFVPLYAGQELFTPMMEKLREMGFSVWAIWPGFCDPATGRMLQVDVVLFRD